MMRIWCNVSLGGGVVFKMIMRRVTLTAMRVRTA